MKSEVWAFGDSGFSRLFSEKEDRGNGDIHFSNRDKEFNSVSYSQGWGQKSQ